MKLESVAEEIHSAFTGKNHYWLFNEDLRVPTVEEVSNVLKRMLDALHDGEQISSGGIILESNGVHLDCYVYVGEIDK